MKDKLRENYEVLHRVFLIAEATLAIGSLIFGGDGKAAMMCYWGIVIIYHVSEIRMAKRDKK